MEERQAEDRIACRAHPSPANRKVLPLTPNYSAMDIAFQLLDQFLLVANGFFQDVADR